MNMLLPATDMNNIMKPSMPNNMQNGMYCRRCGYGGCDVRVMNCGCSAHARCIDVSRPPISQCPFCMSQVSGLTLYPMTFHELDNARRTAAAQSKSKRSKKRKSVPDNSVMFDGAENDSRTGRWTPEEMALCEKLIIRFQEGDLPLTDGVKLNDFLANMLKSKQSRLTKKMKNANLSGKQFKRTNGYIADIEQCKQFSELEDAFFRSLSDPQEQASVRFHMQKEWRELFSSYCVNIGQPLDADSWLSSVEEMEKRESLAKDAARMARRKMMMGIALDQDTQNPDSGVFIERSATQHTTSSVLDTLPFEQDDFLSLFNDKPVPGMGRGNGVNGKAKNNQIVGENRHYWHYASPFLGKVISYIQRHGCPFEHVDAWVPSFVPDSEASEGSGNNNGTSTCRLCYGGSATADVCVPPDGIGPAQLLSQDEQFNLLSFGDYSQKFSFNVGCGLPGRVYENGVPAWEQSVQNAPHQHFERCGGAIQWDIKTVVGIPVPSPNVGRIVVVVYSRFDRNKDQELVGRLYDEFKKLVPSPKWKLVVDIGTTPKNDRSNNSSQNDLSQSSAPVNNDPNTSATGTTDAKQSHDTRLDDLVALLGETMPHDQNSPYYSYLSSFMSLRLMLLKPTSSPEEAEQQSTLLSSYGSYLSSGRAKNDIAVMIARDYMFLKQQNQPVQHQPSPQLQSLLSNHNMHPTMEHLSLPAHPNSIVSNNMSHHPGSFLSFASNQNKGNAPMQQQQQQQQHYPNNIHIQQAQLTQRPSPQRLDSSDLQNQNVQVQMNLPSSSNLSVSNHSISNHSSSSRKSSSEAP